ncbi:hypothetical protein, partial [Desulfoferrobacter suflitae]
LFRRHQARPRKFRILCDALVQVVKCLVIRWKCPGCHKTFTEQPPFALPFKRYTSDAILHRSASYLEDETSTYRKTVLEEGSEIFHASTDEGNTPVDKVLSHTTPYRWIDTLGRFKEIPRRALDLILQKDPATKVYRDLAALTISPNKFVKTAREETLKRSRRLVHLEAVFRVVFGASIFPFFATGCAWQ